MSLDRWCSICSTDREKPADLNVRRRGRPAEDRFLRRMQLYGSVAPLLEQRTQRPPTMETLAAGANMSLGGLRHYFPTRDDLLFFPLAPTTCDTSLRRFFRHSEAASIDSDEFVDLFITSFAQSAPSMRIAVHTALAAGAHSFRGLVLAHLTADLQYLQEALFEVGSSRAADVTGLRRLIRRELIIAALDEHATTEDIALDFGYALGVGRRRGLMWSEGDPPCWWS